VFVAALMVVSAGAVLVAPSSAARSVPPSTPVAASASASGTTGGGNLHASNSSIDQVQGTFFDTNSTFAQPNYTSGPCSSTNYTYNFTTEIEVEYENLCAVGPQDPSAVNFGGAHIGVAYSSVTNDTLTSSCPGAEPKIVTGVFFQNSTDSGANWGTPTAIGNATCSYIQSFDPSAAYADGTVYTAFVESNSSTAPIKTLPAQDNLSTDAIAFTTSSNHGATFAPAITLAAAGKDNLTDPQVAAFGHSVYVLYVNSANWTNMTLSSTSYSTIPFYPTSIDLLYSSDGGAIWSGPYALPGENASSGYMADSPSIAINSQGELAVSYATNHSCILISGSCYDYGDSIVVATSTTNGTSWNAPVTVTPVAGEYGCQNENPFIYQCLPGVYSGPHSAITFDPNNPSRLYVVYTESYYTWSTTTSGEGSTSTTPSIGYGQAMFSATSANNGVTWARSIVEEPESSSAYDFDAIVNPTVTVGPTGTVYVAFGWLNETECGQTCNPAFTDYVSYWMGSSSDNGLTWATYPVVLTDIYEFYVEEDWYGLTTALTVTSAGPVAVYGEGLGEVGTSGFAENLTGFIPVYYYWDNYSYASNLLAAFPAQGTPVEVNFTAVGLPAHDNWSINLAGNVFYSKDPTIQVTNVPSDIVLSYSANSVPIAFWKEYFPTSSVGGEVSFLHSSNVTVTFSIYWGVAFHLSPIEPGNFTGTGTMLSELYVDMYVIVNGVELYWDWYTEQYLGMWYNDTETDQPFPWYFPAGTSLLLSTGIQSDVPISYVYGNGNGSGTGIPGVTFMTVNGPINETYFAGALGAYGLSFVPEGLPSGTAYSFTFDGTTYEGTSPAAVTVSSVLTGEYPLSNVSATSSTPGEVYYAPNVGSEVDIPLQTETKLNFTTEVDTTGTLGTATFHASGLANGDFWQLQFNGTTYGSTTPWINITTRPGTFAVASFPITASANDTTAYTATGFGPTLAVTPGTTYPVDFALAYRVTVSASLGGTATGLGDHWLTPGSTASYSAVATGSDHFLGWAGGGVGSYTGPSAYANITVNAPITETATFAGLPADRYNLTLTETGLPTGTWWTASLNGTGYSSNAATFEVGDLYSCTDGAAGTYPLSIPFVYLNGTSGVRYVASGYPTSTCTSGLTAVTIAFHAEYLVSAYTTGGGNATLSVSGSPAATSAWVASGTSVSISETASGTNVFAGWLGNGTGSYTGTTPDDVINPGGPVSEVATFQAPPTPYVTVYYVNFDLTSKLVAGTSWSVTLDGTTYSSVGAAINVSGLAPASYSLAIGTTFSPDRTVEYLPHTVSSPIDLTANRTVDVAYSTSYWVTVQSTVGGSVSPAQSGYYAEGGPVALAATPAAGYSFVGWVGTGNGSYTGSAPYANATASGPLTEAASFAPSATSTSSTSFLASTTGIIVLAIVGLVVGLAIGIVVFRSRGSKPGSPGSGNSGGSA
jgi:hypothetical protein